MLYYLFLYFWQLHRYFCFTEFKLYELGGDTDFETIVCDPDLLGQYLYVPTGVVDMSSEMCDVDRERIPEIVETLQEHLDMPAIVKMVRFDWVRPVFVSFFFFFPWDTVYLQLF